MTTLARYVRRLAAAAIADGDAPYDEELLLKWESAPYWTRPKKHSCIRLPRVRRNTLCLLLADVLIVGFVVHLFMPLITLLERNEELFGARVTLSAQADSEDQLGQLPNEHRIPRILHQTCATATVPDKWIASQQSCKDAYSDFEYMFWTDEIARDFISREYPWYLHYWDNYAFPIQRADAIRYFVLYHYGGIYLDMDTVCNITFPLNQIESNEAGHHSLYKSTRPTGVTNDFMISSARHPALELAIHRLPFYYRLTRVWARLQPYCAIMVSSGPMFISMVLKNYLIAQPSLPSSTVSVVNQSELTPFITDLESSTWHKGDAKVLMWIGDRPWTWYTMGAIGLVVGLWLINHWLMMGARAVARRIKL